MANENWPLKQRLCSFALAIPLFLSIPNLPEALASGKSVRLEGEIQSFHEDYKDPKNSHYIYYVKTQQGRIRLKGKVPGSLRTGARVRASGTMSDSQTLALSTTGTVEVLAAAAPTNYAIGVQKTVILLVNFQDNTSQPITPAGAQDLVFNKVNSYYLENSYQQTSLGGNVYGWYTLPISGTVCDTTGISTYAKAAATAAGVDLSAYSRFIYFFPEIKACGFAGSAGIGGNPTESFINGYFDLHTVAHELGHNLGLIHAHAMECDISPISNTCTGGDYWDDADVMGSAGPVGGHFNATAKESLGWFNGATSPRITTVQSSGTYRLDPYETNTQSTKALKILKSTDATTGVSKYYYLEYRQLIGFDSDLVNSVLGDMTKGVQVRLFSTGSPFGNSYRLDMTPNSNLFIDWMSDRDDCGLTPAHAFYDPDAGITIKTTSADTTGATVDIVLGKTGCVPASPTVTISPAQQTVSASGTAVNYTVMVKDNDSSACGSSIFDLKTTLPYNDWSATAPSITLSPGGTASTTLTVNSPISTAQGNYSIRVAAISAVTAFSGVGSATYSIVSSTCTRSNPLVSISPSTGPTVSSGTSVPYTVSVTNRDSAACPASNFSLASGVPSGLSGSFTSLALTLSPGAAATTTLNVTSSSTASAGTYSLSATASNASAAGYTGSTNATYTIGTGPTCTHANPLVSFSPASQSSAAGGTLSYSLSVTNKDSSGCSSSVFNLSDSVPSGFTAMLSSSSMSLAPGASAATTLSVKSPLTAATGNYTASATATNASATSSTASVSATYSVTVPVLAVSVTTNATTYSRGNTVTITATVTSGGIALSGASATFSLNGSVLGTVTTGTGGQAVFQYKISKRASASGTYQVSVTASSGGQTASGTTSFTVR